MRVYTDPRLLDMAAAVEALPAVGAVVERIDAQATGTDVEPAFAPPHAPLSCRPERSISGTFWQFIPRNPWTTPRGPD